ncbi:MAG: hypothetical protein V2A79_17195 [Planctomycetota bacterium]
MKSNLRRNMGGLLMCRVVSSPLIAFTLLFSLWGQAHAGSPNDAGTSAHSQSFAAELTYLDTNRNGSIEAAELAHGQQMAAMLLALSWETCDWDHDGKITATEFQSAAAETLQTLLSTASEDEQQAENALAEAVSMSVLLQQLARDQAYADELAALRAAVDDLNDDEAVVTQIISNPARYPRLSPVVRTWVRYYPVKPALRRHLPPYPARGPHLPPPHARPAPTNGHPIPPKHSGPAKPPMPKPGPQPRPGGGGRP